MENGDEIARADDPRAGDLTNAVCIDSLERGSVDGWPQDARVESPG